jgi:GNAT superfamily N-acetyltransferase
MATEAEAQPHSYWEDLTRSVTAPDRHIMFLACEGNVVHGSTYGLLDRENVDAGRVGGMWVDPSRRRQGIGRALMQAVLFWARQRGLKRLGLWAPADNTGANALCRGAGFIDTARRGLLRPGAALQIIEMECAL